MTTFLSFPFTAFAGSRPFDPACNMKLCLTSLFDLLLELLSIKPSKCQDEITSLVPVASNQLAEFASDELQKIALLCKDFEAQLKCFRLSKAFWLVKQPRMNLHGLLGPVMVDLFTFLSSLLDNNGHYPRLNSVLTTEDPPAGKFSFGCWNTITILFQVSTHGCLESQAKMGVGSYNCTCTCIWRSYLTSLSS